MDTINPQLKRKALQTIKALPRARAIEVVVNAAVAAYRKPYEAMIEAGISHELAMAAIYKQLEKNLLL